jgi:polyisoprenoid-binding protein YceI
MRASLAPLRRLGNNRFAPQQDSEPCLVRKPPAQAPELSAQAWTVDQTQSRLGFSGGSDGQPFSGQFNTWDAQIAFDPANLGASSAAVTIALGSVVMEDMSQANQLTEDIWFGTAFPNATFQTSSIRAEGGGYVADGTLTIRGQSKPASLPFTVAIDGDVAKMKGELTINRKDWGLGVGGWQDSHVDPGVKVEVAVTAKKA